MKYLLLVVVLNCFCVLLIMSDSQKWRIVLKGDYIITNDHSLAAEVGNPWVLLRNNYHSPRITGEFVTEFEKYAVCDRYIILQTSAQEYMIIDSQCNSLQRIKHCENKDRFLHELKYIGLKEDIKFSSAEQTMLSLSDQELRPWRYGLLGGLLRFSDNFWSCILLLVTEIAMLAFCVLKSGNKKLKVTLSIMCGMIIGIGNYIFFGCSINKLYIHAS